MGLKVNGVQIGDVRDVPCDGCTACCRKDLVALEPMLGDDPEKLPLHHQMGDMLVLDRKPDGSCVYLGDEGCTVYEDRPATCRSYDCRIDFLSRTPKQTKRACRRGHLAVDVLAAGATRLHTLSAGEKRAARRAKRMEIV